MKFCTQCGGRLRIRTPPGEDRPRHVCEHCGTIHYQNPKIIAGSIPEWKGRILLCRRAIEPRKGLWTLPAGFMESGETLEQAAARETLEEACAEVGILDLYTVFSLPHVDQVHVFFRASMHRAEFAPGRETLETKLVAETEIPWQELAFSTVKRTLEYYLTDRRRNQFRLRSEFLPPGQPGQKNKNLDSHIPSAGGTDP